MYLRNSSSKPHKRDPEDLKARWGLTESSLFTNSSRRRAEREARPRGCFWGPQALPLGELHAGPFSQEGGWATLTGCPSWTEGCPISRSHDGLQRGSGRAHLGPGGAQPFILPSTLPSLLPFDLRHILLPTHHSKRNHQRDREERSCKASRAQGEAISPQWFSLEFSKYVS